MTQITAGDRHTCELASDGTAYCWGDNAYGQLGNGTTGGSNVPVAVSSPPAPATRWAQITAGSEFTCALTNLGKAYCWGRNDHGQLGAGTSPTSSYSRVPVATGGGTELPDGTVLTQISSGFQTTCAMDTESNVYCWGRGSSGELGNGTTAQYSSVPVLVIFQGELMITVPDEVTLSAPAGTFARGQLGPVTVSDYRAMGPGQWTVTVGLDPPLTGPGGSVIPARNVMYTIPQEGANAPRIEEGRPGATVSNTTPVTFTTPSTETPVLGTNNGAATVTWNPTISVTVPAAAVPGVYTATITHSVE